MRAAQGDDAAHAALGAQLPGHEAAVAVTDHQYVRRGADTVGQAVEMVGLGIEGQVPRQLRQGLGHLQPRFQTRRRVGPGAGVAVEAVQEHGQPILGGHRTREREDDEDEHQSAGHGYRTSGATTFR
jgi:hypothetical protein